MHWKHSRFQIMYMILGNCHTYDEAYRVLRELEEDRLFSIESSLAESKRAQSKIVSAKAVLSDQEESKANKLLAECSVDEQAARKKVAQPCLDEARRELDFIRRLIDYVEPLREYRSLPDHEAHQASQRKEWKYDLLWKAYNHLASSNYVPYDLMTMINMHPDAPHIRSALEKLRAIHSSGNLLAKDNVLGLFADDVHSYRLPSSLPSKLLELPPPRKEDKGDVV